MMIETLTAILIIGAIILIVGFVADVLPKKIMERLMKFFER